MELGIKLNYKWIDNFLPNMIFIYYNKKNGFVKKLILPSNCYLYYFWVIVLYPIVEKEHVVLLPAWFLYVCVNMKSYCWKYFF